MTRPHVPVVNIANILTVIRIILVPLFVWFYLAGTTSYQVWATAIFFIAGWTDQLDGYLARSRGLVTDFGKIADPIADKALVIAALILLSHADLVPWWVTVVIIVRELGITFLRFFMIRKAVIAASRGGKIKTTLQMLFIFLLLIPWQGLVAQPGGWILAGHIIMYAAVIVTVVSGLEYCWNAWRLQRHG